MHESLNPRRRRVRPPGVWAAAALLTAALLGASALHFVTASCAAELPQAALAPDGPPSATTPTEGQAYYYNPGGGEGSCSFGPLPSGGLYVSLAPPQYANGASCGGYLDVSGPDGKVQAEIVDQCPGCTDGGLDMSEAAFARVASPAAGTADVSYRLVRDPRPAGRLSVRIAQSSSAGWLALQVIGNGNPLSSVAVTADRRAGAGGWQSLTLNSDGYWAAPAGAGSGPFQVRVTDVFGHRVTLPGIRLLPGSVQHTRVLMYATASGRNAAGTADSTSRPSQPPATAPSTTAPATTGPATVTPGGLGSARPGPTAHAALGGHPSASGTAGPHC